MTVAPVFHVLLYQPEIPPNTGNVIRLCANTGARLHLIEPLGFDLSDRQLKRAGLDYHEYARLQVHPDLDTALARIAPSRLFAMSTRASVRYDTVRFADGDAFLFGPETRGLPQALLDRPARRPSPAPADAAGQPQPQPVQLGRRGGVRGLAPARFRRRPVTAAPGNGERRRRSGMLAGPAYPCANQWKDQCSASQLPSG